MGRLKIQLRDMSFAHASVSDLKHAALIPEVSHALIQWVKQRTGSTAPGVLIGGLALSFYVKPRYTEDVDLLFLRSSEIPDAVAGFKKHRAGAFQENQTHVEIEVNSADSINLPAEVARKVIATSINHDGLHVASFEAMIVLKLFGADTPKRELKDMADIVALLENRTDVDLSDWNLSESHTKRLNDCIARAK